MADRKRVLITCAVVGVGVGVAVTAAVLAKRKIDAMSDEEIGDNAVLRAIKDFKLPDLCPCHGDCEADQYAESDAAFVDTNGDGEVDTVLVDTTGDGKLDTAIVDLDGDGAPDIVVTDDSVEDVPEG